jgi:flagellar biogenesis protein FliO
MREANQCDGHVGGHDGVRIGGRSGGLIGGLSVWLLQRLRSAQRRRPRLALVERIALAPRQSLALVEAEGRRFLVATSPEGAPAFYALDQLPTATARATLSRAAARVSW